MLSLPGSEGLSDCDDLAKMIRVVIRDEQDFAQVGTALAVRNLGGQVSARVSNQADYFLQISIEAFDSGAPCLIAEVDSWPEAAWKVGGFPFRVNSITQYVLLSD